MEQVIRYFLEKIKKDNVGAYAAQACLYLVLSFIPFMLVLMSLIRYTPLTEDTLLAAIEFVSPEYVTGSVINLVDEIYHNSRGVLIFSLVIAVFSAAKAIHSLRDGLNIVYEVEETRNWLMLRLRAMAETFLLILVICLLMFLLMFGSKLQEILLGFSPYFTTIFGFLLRIRMLIIFFVLILFLGWVYKILPNRKATFKSQLVGSTACSIAWYVFSYGVSIYINYFNGFSIYGKMTMVVLILFWIAIAMYIFLICGQLNYSYEYVVNELKLDLMKHRREKMQKQKEKNRARMEENRKRQAEFWENQKKKRHRDRDKMS